MPRFDAIIVGGGLVGAAIAYGLQGRICGPIVAAVIAEARGQSIAETGTYRSRASYKPITVGALADLGT
jgi:2-polyprenyl-6-methoxyphenol hydroxylase-like FAD-dependent oxidoreductase